MLDRMCCSFKHSVPRREPEQEVPPEVTSTMNRAAGERENVLESLQNAELYFLDRFLGAETQSVYWNTSQEFTSASHTKITITKPAPNMV